MIDISLLSNQTWDRSIIQLITAVFLHTFTYRHFVQYFIHLIYTFLPRTF